jgi:hypothetical protein
LCVLQIEHDLDRHDKVQANTTDELLAPPFQALRGVSQLEVQDAACINVLERTSPTFRHNVYVSWEPGPDGFELEAVQRMDERTCMKQQLCVV